MPPVNYLAVVQEVGTMTNLNFNVHKMFANHMTRHNFNCVKLWH